MAGLDDGARTDPTEAAPAVDAGIEVAPGKQYAAFVSYSHAADGNFAPTLQTGLQRLGKSWRQRRAIEVFRDETGLSVNPNLWTSICQAMDGSEYFVLLASPEAARSEWVGKEIERWVARGGASRILPVLTDGTWTWNAANGDFDWEHAEAVTAVHPALRGVFTEEPRHMDMSWAKGDLELTLRNPRFRDQIAELAAPMHHKTKDELEGDDIRQQRRTRRLARGAVLTLTALTIAALAATVLAVVNQREAVAQRDRAEEQAREATSRQLADLSSTITGDGSLPYLLSAQAYRMAPTTQATGAMFGAITRRGEQTDQTGVEGRLVGHGGGVSAATFDPDSRYVATVDQGGTVRVWNLVDSSNPTVVDGTAHRAITYTDGGELVVVGQDATWHDATGGGQAGSQPLDGEVAVAVAPTSEDEVVIGTESGAVLRVDRDGNVVRASDSHGSAITFIGASADGETIVSVGTDGTVRVRSSNLEITDEWRAPTDVYALSPDGVRLALEGSGDTATIENSSRGVALVDVVDSRTGQAVGVLAAAEGYIPRGATFVPDGDEVAAVTTGGPDGAPGLAWIGSIDGKDLADNLRASPPSATVTAVSPDGRLVLVGGDDPVAYLTERVAQGDGFGRDVLPDGVEVVSPLSTDPGGSLLVVRTSDGVGVLDTAGGEARTLVTGDVEGAVLTPGGELLLVADGRVVDVATGQVIDGWTIPLMETAIPPAFSADGRRVAYVVGDARDTANRATLAVVDLDDRQVFEGTAAPSIVDYLVPRKYRMCEQYCSPSEAFLALDPDGSTLAIRPLGELAQRDGGASSNEGLSELQSGGASALVLIDVDEWALRAETELPGPGPVAFTEDGERVEAHDGDRVWNLDATSLQPSGSGFIADQQGRWAYSPDQVTLAVESNCAVQLVDPTSWGTVASVPYGGSQGEGGCDTPGAAWVDGGSTLLTVDGCSGEDCPVRRWAIDGELLFEEACRLAGRNLTRDEWTQFLPDWPYERTCEQYDEPEAPTLPSGSTDPTTSSSEAPQQTSTTATSAPATSTTTTTAPAAGNTDGTVEGAIAAWIAGSRPDVGPYLGPCIALVDPAVRYVGLCSTQPTELRAGTTVALGVPFSETVLYLLLEGEGTSLRVRGRVPACGRLRHERRARLVRMRASRPVGDRLGAFWRQNGWYVLAVCGIAAFVLGYLGFTTYGADTGADWTPTTRLYLTLQLFAVNSGGVAGDVPPTLDIARFLAPLVLATAALGAVVVALQQGSSRVRARGVRGHVIVAGLGDRGLLLASDLHDRGRDVLVLERDAGQPNVAAALRRGIPVLIEDATLPAGLHAARIERADHLIAVAGRSEVNAAIATAVTAVQHDPAVTVHDGFRSFIEIADLGVVRELQTAESSGRSRLGQEFFNLDDRAAQALLDRIEVLRVQPEVLDRAPTLVVVGLGQLGTTVIVEAARRWDGVRFSAGDRFMSLPLRVIACGPADHQDPNRVMATLRSWYPKVARSGDPQEVPVAAAAVIELLDFDASLPRSGTEALVAQLDGDTPACVILALDDQSLQTRAAIALAPVLGPTTRLIVVTPRDGGMAELIGDIPHTEVFAIADEVCSDGHITRGRLEAMARSIHEGYFRHVERTATAEEKRSSRAFTSWERLPEDLRQQNFDAAGSTWDALEAEGYRVVPLTSETADSFEFPPQVVDRLAEREHLRWFRGKHPGRPDPAWADVDQVDVDKSREQVRGIPRMLAYAGLQISDVLP